VDWWSQPFDPRWWGPLLATFVVSATLTWLGIRYAHRRNLIDQPGQRRSHSLPTPRGGGIGIVVAILLVYILETSLLPREALPDLLACACALALVATVGWIDDHGGLAARWRLLAHFAAALLVLLGPEAAGLGYFASGNPTAYARALVLAHPDAADSPFYRLFPDWLLYPMTLLATAASDEPGAPPEVIARSLTSK